MFKCKRTSAAVTKKTKNGMCMKNIGSARKKMTPVIAEAG